MGFTKVKRTQEDRVSEALWLALLAPDDEKAAKASALAEKLAVGLTPEQVEACRADALAAAQEVWDDEEEA